MEKLIELVYYYNSHLKKGQFGIGLTTSVKENGREVPFDKEKEIRKYEDYIISKKYGFIERLIDNNEIDIDKTELYERGGAKDIVLAGCYDIQVIETVKVYSFYEEILMLLSIQDNPIDYLCSILKEK